MDNVKKQKLRRHYELTGGLCLTPLIVRQAQENRIVYCTIAFRNLFLQTIFVEERVPLRYNPITNTLEDIERIVLYPDDDAIVTDAVLMFKKQALIEIECAFVIPIHDQRVGIKSFGLMTKWEPDER